MDILLLGLAFDIFSALSTALNTLFSIFLDLSNTSTTIINLTSIMKNIYVLISVVMLFYITINLLTYLVSPEKLTDKSSGGSKMLIKIIVTLSLLVFTPTIFSLSRDLQTAILKENIIGKIVMSSSETFDEDSFTNAGHEITATLVKAFIRPEDGNIDDPMYDDLFFQGSTSMSGFKPYAQDVNNYEFNWIMALASSLILCLILFGFLFDIAIRLVKLLFMELIAPIPIMLYPISKNNGTFTKWVKACLTTYASLFIRLLLIYFVLFCFVNIDPKLPDEKPVIYSFIIIGALLFAKQLPGLIGDLFGIKSEGFSLNPMARLREVPILGSAVGAVGAAAGGAVTGAALGFRAAGGLRGVGTAFSQGGFKAGMGNLGKTLLRDVGTATNMGMKGSMFGARAGWKQTSVAGTPLKNQKVDKTAFTAGASSVAQAITGNKDATNGFINQMYNNIGTQLHQPTIDQQKQIENAQKSYDKVAQEVTMLEQQQVELSQKVKVETKRETQLTTELTRLNSDSSVSVFDKYQAMKTRVEAINKAYDAAIDRGDIAGATTIYNDNIAEIQDFTTYKTKNASIISDTTVQAKVQQRDQLMVKVSETTAVKAQYESLLTAVTNELGEKTVYEKDANDDYVFNSDGTRKVITAGTGKRKEMDDAKDKVYHEKNDLKKMHGPYNKNS